jgi:hypothetical protein
VFEWGYFTFQLLYYSWASFINFNYIFFSLRYENFNDGFKIDIL